MPTKQKQSRVKPAASAFDASSVPAVPIATLPDAPSIVPDDDNLIENYRAQIAHCDRLKREMDAIQSAIFQTKREIALLHRSGFETGDAIDMNGELNAIVGGTEQATQRILAAAEAIDIANSAMNGAKTAAQRKALSMQIGDSIIAIFEACNFQDLTGQRVGKVMSTMGAIETHIGTMMEIWGGVAAIKACAPDVIERDEDQRLLNGPKLHHSDDYVSQDDIDAMFG